MSAAGKFFVLLIVAASASCGLAQETSSFTSFHIPSAVVSSSRGIGSERHLQSMPLGLLYADSAFAHGYRHGYEEGFHSGDLDIQMGRDPVFGMSRSEYRQASRQYRSFFGSKQWFEKGFDAGFRGGYSDAMSGAAYRLRERIQSAAAGLGEDVLPPSRRAHFDEGFAGGYASAQSPKAPTHGVTTEYVEQYCRTTKSGPYALDYCSGFGRGYLLGMFNQPFSQTRSASLGRTSSSQPAR